MNEFTKQVFRRAPLYYPVCNWLASRNAAKELAHWEASGRPAPPPHIVKQRALRYYAKSYGLRILVETGTCYGDMVEAMKADFDRIFSIELSRNLYETARARFEGVEHICIISGDSGTELGKVMSEVDLPALFWLDGHYSAGVTARGSKDTPICEELNHILSAPDRGHVILLDDARCFGTDPAYPTIEQIEDFVRSRRADAEIVVQDDSIRITPRSAALVASPLNMPSTWPPAARPA
jgi:hypothetical protein